jgi:catechol 2,3-dioxygenase-like lactoylglutathione lyase family enzyme
MLSGAPLVAFVPTVDLERAHAFFGGVLGLTRVESSPFANAYDAHGTMLRVTRVEQLQPPPFTVLGWAVHDVAAAVASLRAGGVEPIDYPGMEQDADGVWTAPSGARVAWFRDPDGNTLSLSQADAGPTRQLSGGSGTAS